MPSNMISEKTPKPTTMTAVEKRIARIRLEPLSDYQKRLLSFQPLAEALVDRIVVTNCMLSDVFTGDINAYVEHRQKKGAAAATINRELAILKRAFTLAIRAGKLLHAHRPYIAMLAEHNVRTGFFEADQLTTVKGKLPAALQPVAEFAYLTGWRVQSEVLPLAWRNVDLKAGTVTLDVGSTKNGEGRTIPHGGATHAPRGTGDG